MQYIRLGQSGLKVSRIGLGMMTFGDTTKRGWHVTADAADAIVGQAVEVGITLFDTADMYDQGVSEQMTGRLLRSMFADRDDYVLATKVYYPMGPGPNDRGLSRKHLMTSIDASLRRLGTNHIDQIHRWDAETPIEETMAALHDIVQAGKSPLHRGIHHARVAVREGSTYRARCRVHTVCIDAKPLQPDLSGGGTRDDPPVPGPGGGRDPL